MTEELKPCPFCGGEVRLWSDRKLKLWITCQSCIGRTFYKYHPEPLAIEAWNRRVHRFTPEEREAIIHAAQAMEYSGINTKAEEGYRNTAATLRAMLEGGTEEKTAEDFMDDEPSGGPV